MAIQIDIDALSGILGSISIACWVVVFTPQIVENFRRSSADGLSLLFIVIWLLGDVFNILGAILQRVLPTMLILAVYYTLADIILLGQCLWYRRQSERRGGGSDKDRRERGSGLRADDEAVEEGSSATETSPLLSSNRADSASRGPQPSESGRPPRQSVSSGHSGLSDHVDAAHLSPATPFIPPREPAAPAVDTVKPRSALSSVVFNTSALILVSGVGVLGWWLTARTRYGHRSDFVDDASYLTPSPLKYFLSLFPLSSARSLSLTSTTQEAKTTPLHFDLWGQVFGYLCAVLYLGSRVPQLLLNYRRKSTEGVSLLFFLFACVGNLTYVLSIFAYEPGCARLLEDGVAPASTFAISRRATSTAATSRSSSSGGGGGQGEGFCGAGEWREDYGRYILVNTSWLIGSAGTLLLDMIIFVQFWWYKGNQAPVLQIDSGAVDASNDESVSDS